MTKPIRRAVPLAALALLGAAASAGAQTRPAAFSVGARALAAAPLGERGEGLDGGTGFGVDVGYEAYPGLAVYLGFSRTAFREAGAADGTRRVDSGVDLGVTTRRPVGGVPLWFRGGAVFHEAETHLAGRADGEDDGKTGVGLESGLGVVLRLGPRLEATPGVVYTAYTLGEGGGVDHLRAEVGVRLRL